MKNEKEKQASDGRYVAIGLVAGTVIGVITGNIGLWLALGVAFGAAFEYGGPGR